MNRFHMAATLGIALCAQSVCAQDVWATPGAPGDVEAGTVSSGPVVLEAGAPATYDAAVLLGTRKVVVRDFAAALKELRDAASREPNRAEAFCRLGDAQMAQSDIPEARAAYETCARFAKAQQDEHHMTLALVGVARTFEHEQKRQEERDAWQAVVTSTSKDEAARTLAQARISVLDIVLKQKQAYSAVRARIDERASKAASVPN